MNSIMGSPELQAIEVELAGPLAAHESKIYFFPGLFSRVNKLHEKRSELGLDSVQLRLVERLHLDFVRAGARFDAATQARYSAITEQLASLTTRFTQTVTLDETDVFVPLNEVC